MEVSRSSFLITILISALLIQHFAAVVECDSSEKSLRKEIKKAKKDFKKAAKEFKKAAKEKTTPATKYVKQKSAPATKYVKEKTAPATNYVKQKTAPAVKQVKQKFEPVTVPKVVPVPVVEKPKSTPVSDKRATTTIVNDVSPPAFGGKPKPTPAGSVKKWCTPKPGTDSSRLQHTIDFACSKIDCGPIQPGGACFEPNTLRDHAAYAMNYYYQMSDRRECDFSGSGSVTIADPSYPGCKYEA